MNILFYFKVKKNLKVNAYLTKIFGINFTKSNLIFQNLGFDLNYKFKDLRLEDKRKFEDLIFIKKKFIVDSDLKKRIFDSIKKKKIRNYKGIRHILHLSVNGQNTKTNAKTQKWKKKIIYNFCYLKIRPTRSNVFVTLTDFNGKVILKSSSGIIKYSGKKKRTAYVIENVVKNLLIKMKSSKIKVALLVIQLYGSLKVYSFKRSIQRIDELNLKFFVHIINISKYAHNGMRKKKERRV